MHMATFLPPAPASPLTSCAMENTGAMLRAITSSSLLFMRREERCDGGVARHASARPAIIGSPLYWPEQHRSRHEIQRIGYLRRHARPDAGGQRGDHVEAAVAREGRAGH